jgi:peptidoglycan/LPS O-acetylase OafA/YrhL
MAFYSLFTRGWELMFGSLLAWAMLRYPHMIVSQKYKYFALFVLLAIIIQPLDTVHPRFDALIVVICTTILLAGQDNWLPTGVLTRSISRIGDWSYSLYLVHWPLFAFFHISYLGVVPQYVKIIKRCYLNVQRLPNFQ